MTNLIPKINRCDFYLLIWVLYSMQDILYPRGPINTGIQFLLIIWGVLAAIGYWNKKSKIIRSTSILLSMYIVYGTLYLLSPSGYKDFNGNEISSYKYLQISLNSLVPIIACFAYTLKGYLSDKRIMVYSILFLIVFFIQYIDNQQKLLMEAFEMGINREEFTNNVAYSFLSLLPLSCFLYKRPYLQYLYLMIVLFFIIMGMKRGTMVIALICMIYFIFKNYKSLNSSSAKRWIIFLSILVVIGIIYLVTYLYENSYYFMHRLDETLMGDSSGRDWLYKSIWDGIISDTSIIHFLFGRGAYSTISFSGHLAHQDWLETFCCNGIIGVLLLIYFFVSLFWTSREYKGKIANYLYVSLTLTFLICFIRTMFSMSIQNFELSQSMLIGFLAAKCYRIKRLNPMI